MRRRGADLDRGIHRQPRHADAVFHVAMDCRRLSRNRRRRARIYSMGAGARSGDADPIAAALLAALLIGEPITPNLVFGLIAVFAGIWIATSDIKKPSSSIGDHRHGVVSGPF